MTTMTRTAGTTVWTIDPAHSNVEFAVRHMMISTVKGRFADVAGTLTLDDRDPTRSRVEVRIGVASIDTRAEQRDQHLRSADFFDVERYPELTFTSTRIARDGGGYRVTGDLTMHGVTRAVDLRATEEGRTRDPWGNDRIAFSASATLNRKDYGLGWNQLLETGGVVVGDEIKIALDAELVKQPDR